MRLALLGLATFFSTLPLLAQEIRVSQSPVTITATIVRTGTSTIKDRPNDDDVNVVTPLDTARYGNTMVLRATLGANENLSGWSLVAVWANWPGEGNAYKFFARKKGRTPVLVPDSVLKLDITDPYVAQNLRRGSGNVVAGSDTHKALAQLNLGGLGVTTDSQYDTHAGIATGAMYGTGRYALPTGASTAYYLPKSDVFVGYGVTDVSDSAQDEIITVTLRIASGSGVRASVFAPPVVATPTDPGAGPGATTESSGSGSLIVGSSGDLNTVPGSSLGSDPVVIATGDTPNLDAAM